MLIAEIANTKKYAIARIIDGKIVGYLKNTARSGEYDEDDLVVTKKLIAKFDSKADAEAVAKKANKRWKDLQVVDL